MIISSLKFVPHKNINNMIGLRKFRVWNHQINRWTDGFVHYSIPKNEMIREKSNLEIIQQVLFLKNKSEYQAHHSPQFQNWLKQVKLREVSETSPEYQNWLLLQN
jgi:hypothetical protein